MPRVFGSNELPCGKIIGIVILVLDLIEFGASAVSETLIEA